MLVKVELLSITPNAEELIERAARTCHQSSLGVDEASRVEFIQKVIKLGHLSVLEHAVATFAINGGSRAFSHQLVRHRMCSFSQRSQRYVSERHFGYVMPPSIQKNDEAKEVYEEAIDHARAAYRKLIDLKVPRQDARFVLPNAAATQLVMTANMREYRHIFKLRCHKTAQWEIRLIAVQMLRTLKEHLPAVFENFVISDDGSYATLASPEHD